MAQKTIIRGKEKKTGRKDDVVGVSMLIKKERAFNLFMLILPFIDLVTSIATWENFFSIGLVIKGLFLAVVVVYLLWKHKHDKKYQIFFALLFSYGLVVFLYWLFTDRAVLASEIVNLVKIFYLPCLILFFGQYKNQFISKKLFYYLSCCFLLLYLVPYFLGIGHNISEVYPDKDLYLSFFYIGNELANIFIILVPVGFVYLVQNHKWFFLSFYSVLVFLMLAILGTKTMYFSVLLIGGYFGWTKRKTILSFMKRHLRYCVLGFFALIISVFFLLPRSYFWQNIKVSFDYYQIDEFRDILTLENINHVIYSNRLSFWQDVHEAYQESSFLTRLMGLGRSTITDIKDIEIDLLDIFYSIGIFGFCVYILVAIFTFRQVALHGVYAFLFGLLCLISLFSGHVLISPMTSTYLALLYGVSYNERRDF